ncbi:GNAT family N-acetyltransferase [Roseospira marina]|uniref:L-ornithine N(alpha)-acyltransferase n=1 Tax=Roseospira marina TaxID=140057 RepID=A0A5M6IAS5_9PROT|nr:GNAT family N-acyltransferase [Roseospira marina]KAA5605381.1 GNAT family N-acetyltransferase [Roseospira marina]MBB4314633.1 putative hemolysin [Roseospira marina]MBB5088762.1 putative hemolysin [Roseospira marina]
MGSLGDLRAGDLDVVLADTEDEVHAAQALRFRIFYNERGAHPSLETAACERDFDAFDEIADHLLVIDHSLGNGPERVVGTYRLMRREHAARAGRFYTSAEYDISAIVNQPCEVMELGRSCVDVRYRNRHTMQQLWRGIAAYVFRHDVGLMFGCASLHGNDVEEHAAALSYLHHCHLAPEALRPVVLPQFYQTMNLMPPEAYDARRVLAGLPPLVKGYLRLNGYVGDGAYIDQQFNTTDVCVIVKTDFIAEKYFRHYDRTARSVPTLAPL